MRSASELLKLRSISCSKANFWRSASSSCLRLHSTPCKFGFVFVWKYLMGLFRYYVCIWYYWTPTNTCTYTHTHARALTHIPHAQAQTHLHLDMLACKHTQTHTHSHTLTVTVASINNAHPKMIVGLRRVFLLGFTSPWSKEGFLCCSAAYGRPGSCCSQWCKCKGLYCCLHKFGHSVLPVWMTIYIWKCLYSYS